MLGEIDRRAEERCAVQAVDEAVDDGARQQLQVADPREDLRIDKPRAGHFRSAIVGHCGHPCDCAGDFSYMPDAGTGTRSSNSSTIESVLMPSDSARKLTSTR